MKRSLLSILFFLWLLNLSTTNSYVVNSNSQTLSRIDIEAETTINNFASLGQFTESAPNKMAIKNNFAYVTITYENAVQKIDLNSKRVKSFIYLEDSSYPNDIVINDNFAYVSGNASNKVYKINLINDTLVNNLEVGLAPQDMTIYDNYLFVANTGFNINDYSYEQGTVSVIDLNNFNVIDTIDVNLNPTSLAAISGKLHVVCTGNYNDITGKVDIIDIENFTVDNTINIGSSPASISQHNHKVFLGNSWPAGVFVYDALDYEIEITPADNIFNGGNTVNANQDYLATIDAGNYVDNSIVYFYDVENYQLVYETEVAVGATDIKFEPASSQNSEDSIQLLDMVTYPNPISITNNETASLKLNLKAQQKLTVDIFNIKGQKVKSLFDQNLQAGTHTFYWDLQDKYARKAASGIYFYKIVSENNAFIEKVILIK